MWKTLFQYLPLDYRIHKLGIPMALACNYCENRDEETLYHVLSTRDVVKLIWKKVTYSMQVFNAKTEPWKVKINRWFCGTRSSSIFAKLLDLLPVVNFCQLWIRGYNAQMDDGKETGEMV